jgi:hypothetical protein
VCRYGRTATPSLLKKNEDFFLMKMQYDGNIADIHIIAQQNPHLSEEYVSKYDEPCFTR